ncbi:hypothetical protein [Clostridioides sp. ES-S-0049-03]|uniref:hypothetical protein n=1 Tax=Clostridioides sp. ES-S-0049-03 TaxID=2770779 RepID=UPI001D112AE1|nr:hypothetical protein [Clostridioides sp. ES-S-0049-03]
MFIRAIAECKNETQSLFESSKRVEAIKNKQSSKTLDNSFARLEYAFVHKDIRKTIKILENELFFEKIGSYKIHNDETKKFKLVVINKIIKMMNKDFDINILKEMYMENGYEGFLCCFGDLF